MRVIIIGAVAAGTSAAAEIRRNHPEVEIIVYEKDKYISYGACSMPYYLAGEIEGFESIVPRTAEDFKKDRNIDILIEHEVLAIDPKVKKVRVKKLKDDKIFEDHYDKLIIAIGAKARVPPIEGADKDHVFVLRNVNDMIAIQTYIKNKEPKEVAILGSGFIGMEMVEVFKALGMNVNLLVRSELTKMYEKFDEMIEDHLIEHNIKIYKDADTKSIADEKLITKDGREIEADLVLIATGIKPEVKLAKEAGVKLGELGAILVDEFMKTNFDHIYACGDCVEVFSVIDKKQIYKPLGTTANKTGVIAGSNVSGVELEFKGILGTGIYRIFDLAVGTTGYSEEEAKDLGYKPVSVISESTSKAESMGGGPIYIQLVADKEDGKLLGAQVLGYEGVDKRLDVLATAISLGARAEDLMFMDLAYSPPFSRARDPIYYAGVKLRAELAE